MNWKKSVFATLAGIGLLAAGNAQAGGNINWGLSVNLYDGQPTWSLHLSPVNYQGHYGGHRQHRRSHHHGHRNRHHRPVRHVVNQVVYQPQRIVHHPARAHRHNNSPDWCAIQH